MTGIVRLVMVALVVLAIALFFVAASAWRQRRHLSSSVGFLAGAVCLLAGLLCAAITVGVRGYRALTQEVVAATIKTEPIAPQRFRATVTLPDGSLHMFDLAGDAVYVDAHVLKWRAPLLGAATVRRCRIRLGDLHWRNRAQRRHLRSPRLHHRTPGEAGPA